MQREITDRVFLGQTVSLYEDACRSSAIDRTAWNYNNAQEKIKKMRKLISTGKYDEDIGRYIPGILELKFQWMVEDINIREKVTPSSCTDMEELDFQIILTDNYYVNPNSIHICFHMKIKKKKKLTKLWTLMMTVNNSQ